MLAELPFPSIVEIGLVPRALIGGIVGAIVGSFLGTILVRWPAGRSVTAGRSGCDHCGHGIQPQDLIPLLSFLLLRGRCRHCSEPIDPRQFAVEVASAMVGAIGLASHALPSGLVAAILGWWLLLVGALDAEHHWLPDILTLPLAATGLIVAVLGVGPPLVDRLTGAAAGYLLLLAVAHLYRAVRSRDGLGGGDSKLFGALGAWLGWQMLPALLIGAGLIGFASLGLAHMRGKEISLTGRLPFGSLLAVAAWPLWIWISQST